MAKVVTFCEKVLQIAQEKYKNSSSLSNSTVFDITDICCDILKIIEDIVQNGVDNVEIESTLECDSKGTFSHKIILFRVCNLLFLDESDIYCLEDVDLSNIQFSQDQNSQDLIESSISQEWEDETIDKV